MIMPRYINGMGSVSAQRTFEGNCLPETPEPWDSTMLYAVEPNYKEFIPPAQVRRMAKGIKMGTASARTAISDAGLDQGDIDTITVGTGLGCIGDSEQFVRDIIDNQEQYLTPTRFIQSSHNSVGGQLALAMGCRGHNFTFVHSAVSFESALLDAVIQLDEGAARHVLTGGVDELGPYHIDTHRLIEHIKKDPVPDTGLLGCGTRGSVFSEGAHFFVLSGEKADTSFAQLKGLHICNSLSGNSPVPVVNRFLQENGIEPENIDLVLLGYNGDTEFDGCYTELANDLFEHTPQAWYKHLCGEYYTASAFGFWLACRIIRDQAIPAYVRLNDAEPGPIENVLLYNQYRGANHSIVWLGSC